MVGIVLMIVAALLNAAASVLQRRATKDEPDSAAFSVGMVLDLVRRPAWILGILAMLSGFLLHGISISLSQLALVQPLLVAELPFTLILASWAFRMPIPRRDWLAIGMQSAGLAAFVGCLAPSGGDPRVPAATWALGIGATVIAVITLVVLGYHGRHEHRAALLGIATGATFGLNSSLIAGIGAAVSHGGNLITTWQTYGVAVIAPLSFFMLQNALQAGNLVASQPGFTLTNPLVSVAWGLAVFDEHARSGLFLIGTISGAALIGLGTIMLAQSVMLDPTQHEQQDRSSGESGTQTP
ncbi:DMT family transporter [Haloactinomyces albus]|uniref:Drug/metabolite transporter (DMT)-like permease n=1 Tax=Haloactinomyces albus TaxID=1352928 RepID=A0AAE3Z7N0_9ACTN|nr:DMT family transporter [Haloactinomyces albus]MDR7299837.1 drug/metabolite transporter (DMT)-like permease [Haloactinomyces albus]